MKLSRWSLGQLVTWIGMAALAALFVPITLYCLWKASAATEQSLDERGRLLARAVAGQMVRPMLLKDDLAMDALLDKARQSDADVRYLCAVGAHGDVAAHTLPGSPSSALRELWRHQNEEPVRFRSPEEPLLDVAVPILEGQLGAIHVGLSRAAVRQARHEMLWMAGGALAGGLLLVFGGARLISVGVSRPLRHLEAAVSKLPAHGLTESRAWHRGTREVRSLAGHVTQLCSRLEALQRERAATQHRMVQAERLATVGELAAGLAHEIHNPLDGMLECVRYLQAEPAKTASGSKYYPLLQDGLERIGRVMKQMLNVSRREPEISLEASRLSDLLESLALLVQPQLNGRRVRLTWQTPGPCVCLCDRHRVAQAALNLILNALETTEGRPRSEIRVESHCDRRRVYVVVEDSGSGVPAELRERIFDPFFSTKVDGKGTGLGLPVSRQLVRAAGGDLTLCPEPGTLGGARFVISLQKVPTADCCNDGPRDPNTDRR